jgi:hypothetical protein
MSSRAAASRAMNLRAWSTPAASGNREASRDGETPISRRKAGLRALASSCKGENPEGTAFLCANAVPEGLASDVLLKNEEMALLNALMVKRGESSSHELAAKSPPTVRGGHCQVVDQTTTPIVTAENRRNQHFVFGGDEAELGIALEKSSHILEGVGVAEADSLGQFPQCSSLNVVFRLEHANFEAHP